MHVVQVIGYGVSSESGEPTGCHVSRTVDFYEVPDGLVTGPQRSPPERLNHGSKGGVRKHGHVACSRSNHGGGGVHVPESAVASDGGR